MFIGNPPTETNELGEDIKSEKEHFHLMEMRNNKSALVNGINDRYLVFQRPIEGSNTLLDAESEYFNDEDSDLCLGFVNCSLIHERHDTVKLDYNNLNPKLYQFTPEGDTDRTQIFVNIDTSVFTPLIYQLPDGAIIKDTYHYGKQFYGFILEVEENLTSLDPGKTLRIYGYDHRYEETHMMEPYHMYELIVDARYATKEELEEHGVSEENIETLKYANHSISISHTGMNKKDRKTFFRMRSMYTKNSSTRMLKLNGPLFTTQIIGTLPVKEARELIKKAKDINQIPKDTQFTYTYVSKSDYKDIETWFEEGIMKALEAAGKANAHAVTLTDDIPITLKDARRVRMQQVLHLSNDGTITSAISNR